MPRVSARARAGVNRASGKYMMPDREILLQETKKKGKKMGYGRVCPSGTKVNGAIDDVSKGLSGRGKSER